MNLCQVGPRDRRPLLSNQLHQEQIMIGTKVKMQKPLEVMKREDGNYAVRWSHQPKKWALITQENEEMFVYIVWWVISQ